MLQTIDYRTIDGFRPIYRKISMVMTIDCSPPLGPEEKLAKDEYNRRNHFTFIVSDPVNVIPATSNVCWMTGPETPFTGYKTKTGLHRPVANFQEKNTFIMNIYNMLDLKSFCAMNAVTPEGAVIFSNLGAAIDRAIEFYTTTSKEELANFASQYRSGTAHYHLRSRGFREAIMINSLANMFTMIRGSTNTHVEIQENKGHYLINFLHAFCYMQ